MFAISLHDNMTIIFPLDIWTQHEHNVMREERLEAVQGEVNGYTFLYRSALDN